MTIEIKILGLGDVGILSRIGPGVFDNNLDDNRSVEFLRNPRHHLPSQLKRKSLWVLARQSTTYIQTRPPSCGSMRLAWRRLTGTKVWARGCFKRCFQWAKRRACGTAWVLTDRSKCPSHATRFLEV